MNIYDVLDELLGVGGRSEDHARHRRAVLAKARDQKVFGDPQATNLDEAVPGRLPGQVAVGGTGPVIDLNELARQLLAHIGASSPAPAAAAPAAVETPAPSEPAASTPAPLASSDIAAQLAKALGQA
jgi:hypothetical protein